MHEIKMRLHERFLSNESLKRLKNSLNIICAKKINVFVSRFLSFFYRFNFFFRTSSSTAWLRSGVNFIKLFYTSLTTVMNKLECLFYNHSSIASIIGAYPRRRWGKNNRVCPWWVCGSLTLASKAGAYPSGAPHGAPVSRSRIHNTSFSL